MKVRIWYKTCGDMTSGEDYEDVIRITPENNILHIYTAKEIHMFYVPNIIRVDVETDV